MYFVYGTNRNLSALEQKVISYVLCVRDRRNMSASEEKIRRNVLCVRDHRNVSASEEKVSRNVLCVRDRRNFGLKPWSMGGQILRKSVQGSMGRRFLFVLL